MDLKEILLGLKKSVEQLVEDMKEITTSMKNKI